MSRTSSLRRRPSASRPKLVPKKLASKPPAGKERVQRNSAPQKPASAKPAPQTPLQRELSTKRRGELAEIAFILKAANLGFGVARPFGDSERYDVILDARDPLPRLSKPERGNVGRTLLSAALDVPPASENAASEKKSAKNRTTTSTQKAPRRTPRRKPADDIPDPTAPDPSPPLWRVQVKCSTQLSTGLYRINAHRRLNGRAVPYLPGEIHFFAAYIIPEDTWYLIPLAAARGVTSLLFRRRRDPKPGLYDAYREAWHLLRP
jgi:hypothetical protein